VSEVALAGVLDGIGRRVVACSGGIDSLLLATVAHRLSPDETVVAHDVTPAVPAQATARVVASAEREGWRLEIVTTAELEDERYASNPTDRCYACKSHLYTELGGLSARIGLAGSWTTLSGTNRDDLGEYRPGLRAADEHLVRHPYVDAGLGNEEIRTLPRQLQLSYAELPAGPCLASRLYTGTRVTAERLRAVEAGEEVLRHVTPIEVVRCRIRGRDVLVEVQPAERHLVTARVLALVTRAMRATAPALGPARLDDHPYSPGRAIAVS